MALAAAAVILAACGSYGDGGAAAVEESVAASIRVVLDRDAPLVEIRSVACDGTRPDDACRVELGVGSEIVQADYDVRIGDDGCWQGSARRIAVIGAGAQTNPLADATAASDLRGCVR